MKFKTGIKVSAPATVANLVCGFETLGLALEHPSDEILIKEYNQPGIHLTEITGDKKKLSLDLKKNAAGAAAQAVYNSLVEHHDLNPKTGIALELRKRIPIGFGLGSSSASAVAGAMAVNECFGRPFEKRELLKFAAKGEEVAEGKLRLNSIAPSLLGGLFLVRDHKTFDIHRIPVLKGLHIVVVYPSIPLFTGYLRGQLKSTVSLDCSINQCSNVAGLVVGFYQSDIDLIGRCLEDCLVEDSLVKHVPHLYELRKSAKELGALGCGVSSSGSGVFALCTNSFVAENVKEKMLSVYAKYKIRGKGLVSKVNLEGAKLE
ncbi:MAG: homoserine kinase [Aureispira sp.]|nr:homoserine kinase [Aureispira sp.]